MKKLLLVLGILAFSAASFASPEHPGRPNPDNISSTVAVPNLPEFGTQARQHRVVVYYTTYCDACHRLMANLNKLGVHYTAVNAAGRSDITFVPVLVIDGKQYIGYQSVGQLQALLR